MHEMSLARNIVELAVDTAGREGGNRVSEVEIEVGSMAGVMADALEFCLEAAARATIAEGAAFKLVGSRGEGLCPACRKGFEADSFYAACPGCGQEGVAVSGGRELRVLAVTIED